MADGELALLAALGARLDERFEALNDRLAGLSQRLDRHDGEHAQLTVALAQRLDRHDAIHAQLSEARETGAERARAAERQIMDRIVKIQTMLDLSGSPVDEGQRITRIESAIRGLNLMVTAIGASIALVVASVTGLIGAVVQSLGGNRPPHT